MVFGRHPGETALALYAGGETGWLQRKLVARHIAGCEVCARRVAGYTEDQASLETFGSLPADFRWDELAVEMQANIRLGLAAGECVAPAKPAKPEPVSMPIEKLGWKPAIVFAATITVVLSGWLVFFPRPEADRAAAPIVLGANADGIEVRQGNRAVAIMHAQGADVHYNVEGEGSIRARYVDSETGQITISQVYGE